MATVTMGTLDEGTSDRITAAGGATGSTPGQDIGEFFEAQYAERCRAIERIARHREFRPWAR